MPTRSAILIIDPQNDFCPGGALAVPGAHEIMPVLNGVLATLDWPVFVSRDWHPEASAHFRTWPAHCVAGTEGAAFHPDLVLPGAHTVISKGTDPKDDGGYSAFDGRDGEGRSLHEALTAADVTHLLVAGLATDYCVKASVLSARAHGFEVTVLVDAVRGIDRKPGDVVNAIIEMGHAGARFACSHQVLAGEA